MHEPDPELDKLARLVIGAAITVLSELGPGFLEKVYEEALCVEFARLGIEFERQKRVEVTCRDAKVGEAVIDLIVGGRLVVELKAVEAIHPVHLAQVISYLRTIGEPLGLLLNFQVARMKDGVKRVVWTK
ncbi:MAG: GxxExxY protein [Planctomycetes bacterium]|nr:GxxExxY protein [Planctomycetota bacterium]MCW8135546.1 GxxExxY protein [Planctomycetota bacterium]